MNLHLVNEYSSDNLGDAVIYESLTQLAAPYAVRSNLEQAQRERVRGLLPSCAPCPDDLHVSVGGDIFNNARRVLVTKKFLQNARSLAVCPPERCFLFGQSIPESCQGLSFRILCGVLRRLSNVTVRDELSYQRLSAAGLKVNLSFDVAFGYRSSASSLPAGRALFEKAGIDPGRCVLVSVRSFNDLYPHDNRLFTAKIAELCRLLALRGHIPVILLQAEVGARDSDKLVVAELRHRIPQLAVLQPLKVGGEHHPIDALVGAIALAHAVVAVRFHTTVLRLLAGRQSYNLNYSIKGQDITRRLNLPGVDLDLFEPSQAVKAIESSAPLSFNPAPQRENVHSAFEASMSKALSMPWSLQCGDNSSAKKLSNALMQRDLAINSASLRL
jgi:polysaccharide pyruvyl transferase WcaK-like protein